MTDQATNYRQRVDGADWAAVVSELDAVGCALLPPPDDPGWRQ